MSRASISAATNDSRASLEGLPRQGLVLVVVRGNPAGERFAIGERELVIGRSMDAEVRLNDRRVSRRHARVSVGSDGARFRCCAGAAPIFVGDTETRDGVAGVGQQIVIGETVLVLDEQTDGTEATDVQTLLS